MFYTTFPQKKQQFKKIDYLELIIQNKKLNYTDRTKDFTSYITVQTKEVPNFIKEFYEKETFSKELITALKNFIKTNNFLENKNSFYRKFKIPKRKGGWRHLIEPNEELKRIQQTLLHYLSASLNIRPFFKAHAFEPGKDAYTNAYEHRNSDYIIKYDFEDFFTSITK